MAKLKSKTPLKDKSVAITFDDGFTNLLNVAIPELNKRNMPYTIFVNPGMIALGSDFYLNWQQLKELGEQGATIANHGWDHEYWVRDPENIPLSVWRKKVKKSILDTEAIIKEKTGQSHKFVAFPYGEYNHWLNTWLQERGYTSFAQHSGSVGYSLTWQALPRFPASGIYANLKTLKTKLYSLPMPIKSMQPVEPMLAENNNPPEMMVVMNNRDDMAWQQLACFVPGQDSPKPVWISKNTFKVKALKQLGKGRSRYNCTAPSKKYPGRYYWLSQYWLWLH
nr:polysaccharide deacetylase family protein [Marinifaba aquimaris]